MPPAPEGYIRASLAMSVSENEQIKTRAADIEEKAYDDAYVWVLMFNAASASDATPTTLVQAPIRANKTGAQLYALLRATAQPVTIYVVTGLSTSMNTYLGTATNFGENSTTYTDIRTQLQTEAVTATGVPVGGTSPVHYIPMCTDAISYTTGIVSLSQIMVSFKRIVAKIDVDASTLNTDNFTLEGVTLLNGAQKGLVLPQTPLITNNGGAPVQYTEVNSVAMNKVLSQIYLYENNGVANPTKVIVKGKYKGGASSYYRMDLHKETAGAYIPYDIERNKCYTISISEVQNGGYATLAEAVVNSPSNAEYTVTVTNPDAYDIVSNGEYYIGVSNSELVVYGDGELSNQLAMTVIHNANSSTVTTNSISVSGGLTAVTTSLTAGANTTDKKTDVLITLPASFTPAMTGAITIKLGNLTKTIKVTRKAPLSVLGGVVSDFSGTDYISGVVENLDAAGWLKFSVNADGSNSIFGNNKPVVSLSGGIYLIVLENITTSGGSNREGTFFVSRRTDQGRVRVVVKQGFIDAGAVPTNPLTYPYVGAFWRANQTGERLIRMQVDVNNLGAWSAKVLDGATWIVLDTELSTDPNIGWKTGANESLVADMNTADASYQVTGDATSVSGTALADTDYIYFRIGLKSRLALISAPRYARILVAYNNNSKAQIIYLRQGETADYLFLPTDPYGNSPAGVTAPTWRPDAQKFSPYNLTDPNMGLGGVNTTDHNQLRLRALSAGENRFTAYPSQAGALFQWAINSPDERRAYHPTNPTGAILLWPSATPGTYWNTLGATHETCPQGYRRPNDGVTNAANVGGAVAGSEMRQSLYLSPPADITSNAANTLWGYYADGFFDRRLIQDGLGDALGSNAAVSNNNKNAAYIGRLFFNPTTNASIFFSAAGYRDGNNSLLRQAGYSGCYWSSSAVSATASWSLQLGRTSVGLGQVNRNNAFSVRCAVVQPNMVNFNANGGGGTVPGAMTVMEGNSITLPEQGSMTPPVAGNVFVGWSSAVGKAFVGRPGATYSPTANTTLYAVWSPPTVLRITRGTGSDGRPMLVFTDNPNDLGLYFLFGSLVGVYGGAEGTPYAPSDVAYDPRTDTPNITAWANIPYADETSFPTSLPAQSVVNKNLALGDPCRLVGLTKTQIESGVVDNGIYRLPTIDDIRSLIAMSSVVYNHPCSSWITPTGMPPGRMFPGFGSTNNWLPAAGMRYGIDGVVDGAGYNAGLFLTASPYESENKRYRILYFYKSDLAVSQYSRLYEAVSIYCISQ